MEDGAGPECISLREDHQPTSEPADKVGESRLASHQGAKIRYKIANSRCFQEEGKCHIGPVRFPCRVLPAPRQLRTKPIEMLRQLVDFLHRSQTCRLCE